MKTIMIISQLVAGLGLITFSACTSNDYNNKESTTTEVTSPDTANTMMPDTSRQMMNDSTNTMMPTDTAATTSTNKPGSGVKGKKGKVTSTLMMNSEKNMPMNQDKKGYYSSVEILPAFPGGQNALNDYISRNIEYPDNANDNGVEGVVTVNFAVDESGKVSNPRITGKPLGYGLEDEVLKAINKMPLWTPGVIKGKNVKTYYTLPVNFKLEQ